MRIGIDARFLTHPQLGGFKTYTENLVRELVAIDGENEYYLYVDRPAAIPNLEPKANIQIRVVEGWLPGIKTAIREQLLLGRAIAADKVDVAHFMCNTAPVQYSGKYVLTLHDTIQVASPNPWPFSEGATSFKRWGITAYSKWSIKRAVVGAARVITVSQFERNNIIRDLNLPDEKISVTHLAASDAFKPICDESSLKAAAAATKAKGLATKYLLGVGYERRKNVGLLIRAFALVARSVPDLELVLVCADQARAREFTQLASDCGVSERIMILGSQPADQLAILYNCAQMFIYPSQRESFGLPPLEAMACGTPTLALNASSIPEIVGDGARLIDSLSPKVWGEAILQLLRSPEQLDELHRLGLNRAAELTWRACAQKTIAVYSSVGVRLPL